jgi:hypothetical protein
MLKPCFASTSSGTAVLKAVKARDTSRADDAERWRAARHALRVCLREKSPHLAVSVTRHDHD